MKAVVYFSHKRRHSAPARQTEEYYCSLYNILNTAAGLELVCQGKVIQYSTDHKCNVMSVYNAMFYVIRCYVIQMKTFTKYIFIINKHKHKHNEEITRNYINDKHF